MPSSKGLIFVPHRSTVLITTFHIYPIYNSSSMVMIFFSRADRSSDAIKAFGRSSGGGEAGCRGEPCRGSCSHETVGPRTSCFDYRSTAGSRRRAGGKHFI